MTPVRWQTETPKGCRPHGLSKLAADLLRGCRDCPTHVAHALGTLL